MVLDREAPHLRVPYEVWAVFRKWKGQKRVILEELFRASAGWHTNECVISIDTLAKHAGIKATQVREHLKPLIDSGVVERLGDVTTGNKKGIRFRINLPRMPPSEIRTPPGNRTPRKPEPNKERTLKSKDINREIPSDEEVERVRAELEKEFPHLREGK